MSTYQLKVSLKDTDPLVWRRIIVPDRITFHQLHLILQQAFEWKDYHLYQFTLPGVELPIRRFFDDSSINDGVLCDGRETFIDAYMHEGLRFLYEYDLSDGWDHIVDLEKIDCNNSARCPFISDYQGDSLPEDCGGVYGYYRLLRILADPKHPEYRFMKDWAEWQGMKTFNPDSFNELAQEMLYFPLFNPQTAAIRKAGKAGPRVSLQDVVDAFSYQSDTLAAYINLDTMEVALLHEGEQAHEIDDLQKESREKYESCNSLMLPSSYELNDYRIMETFAQSKEGVASEKLQKALKGRGAFRRFKEAVTSLGVSDMWFEFHDEAYRDIARDFLEANGLRWK